MDLKSSEGLEIFKTLVEKADIVVENFRPGVTKRLGIDYEVLKSINPRLIYASISGFGQNGPLSNKAAYDHIIQAMGGIMQVTGWEDGEPTRVGDAIGDVVAGLYGSWGVLAAMIQRGITGKGQHLDVSMLDTMVTLQMISLVHWIGGEPIAGRIGNSHPISSPMDSYSAADGHIVIAVANDKLFRSLTLAMNRPELSEDPRFITDPLRLVNQHQLREEIEKWLKELTIEEAVIELDLVGVPAAPVWDLETLLDSEYVKERGIVKNAKHPKVGTVPIVPQPVKMSSVTTIPELTPALLGEHTQSILSDLLGMDEQTIVDLKAKSVI